MARSTSTAPTPHVEPPDPDRWLLEEEDVPESLPHARVITLLVSILTAWIARTKLDALVAYNLALRWDPLRPRVGADPDILLMQPAPPEGFDLTSLQLWQPGHHPPRVAVEVVSINTAEKDYLDAPERYVMTGVHELWIFDPKGFGPAVPDGPYLLQVWRRTPGGRMDCVYAGDGPAFSDELGAWLVVTDGRQMLRLADDREGVRLWPTEVEVQAAARDEAVRARDEAERARDEAVRAREESERLLRLRIEELERQLASRG